MIADLFTINIYITCAFDIETVCTFSNDVSDIDIIFRSRCAVIILAMSIFHKFIDIVI